MFFPDPSHYILLIALRTKTFIWCNGPSCCIFIVNALQSRRVTSPCLLGIVNLTQEVANEMKGELGLAQEFLELIDSWARIKEEKQAAVVDANLMEMITFIVTTFALDQAETQNFATRKAAKLLNALSIQVAKGLLQQAARRHRQPKRKTNTCSFDWLEITTGTSYHQSRSRIS